MRQVRVAGQTKFKAVTVVVPFVGDTETFHSWLEVGFTTPALALFRQLQSAVDTGASCK